MHVCVNVLTSLETLRPLQIIGSGQVRSGRQALPSIRPCTATPLAELGGMKHLQLRLTLVTVSHMAASPEEARPWGDSSPAHGPCGRCFGESEGRYTWLLLLYAAGRLPRAGLSELRRLFLG